MFSVDDFKRDIFADFEAGKLFWNKRSREMFPTSEAWSSWNTKYAGKEAFTTVDFYGYRKGSYRKKTFTAHRVLWMMLHGEWPDGEIDHINGVRGDNRIENLRCVTHAENLRNQRFRKENTSGVTGVYWNKRDEKWKAYIRYEGVMKMLIATDDFDEAVDKRRKAELDLGFHEHHGRRS